MNVYVQRITGLGWVRLCIEGDVVREISFGVLAGIEFVSKSSDRALEIFAQLEEYMQGKRNRFEMDWELMGTAFQRKVWDALVRIPYGETKTYSEIAAEIDSHKAVRAVGTAIGKNPLAVVVPCHRVVGKVGLGGYAGGLEIKRRLLEIENGVVSRKN